MRLLEEYYNIHFKKKGNPKFKDLDEKNKKSIEDTLGFAFFQLNRAVKVIGREIRKTGIKV